MLIPNKVRIHGRDYALRFDESVWEDNAWGHCVFHKSSIRFAPEITAERLPSVLIHELIHAISFETGHGAMGDEEEEKLLRTLGNGLADALQQLGLLPQEIELAE